MVVMAAAQGKRHQVINIGVNVRRMGPGGIPVAQWAQGHQHKVALDAFCFSSINGLNDYSLLANTSGDDCSNWCTRPNCSQPDQHSFDSKRITYGRSRDVWV